MTTTDPDAVQVLAAALHRLATHHVTKPYSNYSERYRAMRERHAVRLLEYLAGAGYAVTTRREAQ